MSGTMFSAFCLRCRTREVTNHLIHYFNMFADIGGIRAGPICAVNEELKGAAA